MRITLKLLNQDISINNISYISDLSISRGETADVIFQLVQENGVRYIPADGAVIMVSIPRNSQAIPLNNYERENVDNSINRQADFKFAGDKSIWSIPLTATETEKMISGAIKVTVTEGSKIKKCQLNQAIRIIDGQER